MRLALVAGLLLAGVTTARADWAVRSVPGTPSDVEVWAPGIFSVSTEQGAWLMHADGGVPASISTTAAVGTYRTSAGCFITFLSSDATINRPAGCSSVSAIFKQQTTLYQVKATESGAAYAVGKLAPEDSAVLAFTSPASGGVGSRPWTPEGQQFIDGVPVTLGASRVGDSEHALLALRSSFGNTVMLQWIINGGAPVGTYTFNDTVSPPRVVEAIDLFAGGGSTPSALYGFATGLYRGTLTEGGSNPFTPVSLPVESGRVTGVDVNTDAGTAYGDGFGMATLQGDGGVVLLSAVPASRPEEVGRRWQVNPKLPAEVVSPRYLECRGAEFCVIAQAVADTNNVFLYTNAAPPTITVDAETFVQEGTRRTLPVRVSDPDGDAVRVTVEPLVASPPLSLSTSEVDGGVEVLLDAHNVCADTPVPIRVTASDGLAQNDRSKDVLVRVIHSRSPEPPGIADRTIVVEAGQPDVSLELTAPTSAACPIAGYRWSTVPRDAPVRDVNGLSATFLTPDTLCDRDGVSYQFRVETLDDAGLPSAPTDFTVQVLPWGLPATPFLADKQVLIPADGGTRLTPERTHVCAEQPGSGFPGVDTLWALEDGSVSDGGIRLLTQDGRLISGTSAVTPELRIETDACAAGTLALSVRHFVRGSSSDAGPSSTVQVTVDPQWNSPLEGQLVFANTHSTSDAVAGSASVGGVNCLAQRGGVRARISVEREDGTPVRSGIFTVPGPWWLALGDACEGGNYRITGELLADGPRLRAEALTGGERMAGGEVSQLAVTQITVPVPPVELQLAPLEAPRLTARCGEGARGTLEQRLPEGPCSSVPLSWEQRGGPALTQAFFTGPRIDVATQETDFGALIGESVVLRVTANTGTQSQIDQIIPITAEPFVEVHRHTEQATGTEADLVGVAVELRNTTACGVSQVDHVEHLEGADYVPGSARFNGTPVEPELEGETLTVRGLVLEGGTTGRLTYVVRPRLLGWSSFEGQSSLRGVPISQPVDEPPPSGCGCAGGGSGFAALGLAGLAAVLRRRRGR